MFHILNKGFHMLACQFCLLYFATIGFRVLIWLNFVVLYVGNFFSLPQNCLLYDVWVHIIFSLGSNMGNMRDGFKGRREYADYAEK